MSTYSKWLFFYLSMFFLSACGASSIGAKKSGELIRGVYIEEFERQELISCDGMRFWVSNPSKVRVFGKLALSRDKPVEVIAVTAAASSFAKLAGYDREVFIMSATVSDSDANCDVIRDLNSETSR